MKLFAFVVVAILPSMAMSAGEQPVARVGARVFTHRDIDCTTQKRAAETVSAAVCLEREQRRLHMLMARELLEAGIRKRGIDATEAELAADAKSFGYGEKEFARLSELYRGVGRAALLIRRGADPQSVYQRDLAASISEREFRRIVDIIPDVAAAEAFIDRHSADYFRESALRDARRRIGKAKLIEALSSEAASRGVTFQSHAETFWRELAAEIGVDILDSRYKTVPWKELLWQPPTSGPL